MKRLTTGLAAVLVLGLSSCGVSPDDDPVWAGSLEPHQCGNPVRPETADGVPQVRVVPCKDPHSLEVYALAIYQDPHWLKPVVGDSPEINRNIICVVQSAGPKKFQGSVQTRTVGKAS